MGTYVQWAKARRTLPLAWVCGDQPALAREVTAAYRASCPADCQYVLTAGDGPDRDVWDVVLTDPLPTFPRLLTVRAAERLRDLAPMAALAAAASADGPRTVFVSAEADFARVPQGDKKVLAPHLAILQASRHGQLVRCCAPARAEDQLALVASWWPGAGPGLARMVLRACGGDLTLAWQACDKAGRAGLAAESRYAGVVCEAEPGASFADPLVAGNKAAAIAAAHKAGPEETGAGIGLLAAWLRVLAAIREARPPGGGPLVRVEGVDRFLLHKLGPFAGPYDSARVARCREVLAMAEHFWRSGAREGVAAAVVALW